MSPHHLRQMACLHEEVAIIAIFLLFSFVLQLIGLLWKETAA